MRYALALLLVSAPAMPVWAQTEAVKPADDAEQARAAKVMDAIRQMQNKDAAGALAALEPVLAEYDRLYPPGGKYRCADEMSPPVPAGFTSLNNTWCYALWAKGFALVELSRLPEAVAPLQRATELMPDRPQFFSELGYVQQALKQWQPSLAAYNRAAELGAALKDPADRKRELRRAWFGIAYDLIELDKLDEAEMWLKKCLELTPDDEKVKSELQYVQEQRAKKKS